ncbi:MAG: hypothetical protein AAF830_12030 [Pseudomonadota bacterium]
MNSQIVSALVAAGAMLLVAFLGVRAQDMGLIGGETERMTGVVVGFILVWFANLMPKSAPDASCTADQACAFRMKRFAGIVLMIGGALHAAIWLFAPAESMAWLSTIPVVIALGLIAVRVIRSRMTTIV